MFFSTLPSLRQLQVIMIWFHCCWCCDFRFRCHCICVGIVVIFTDVFVCAVVVVLLYAVVGCAVKCDSHVVNMG